MKGHEIRLSEGVWENLDAHEWFCLFSFDDGTIDDYTNYGTASEMVEWIFDYMNYRTFIIRTDIWCDGTWWGNVIR